MSASCPPVVIATATSTLTSSDPLVFLSVGYEPPGPYVIGGWVYLVILAPGPTEPLANTPDHYATIYRVSTAGGALAPIATFGVRYDRYAVQLGFDAQYVYWAADHAGVGPGETDGTIMRAELDGSNVTTLLGGLHYPDGVAVVDGAIYFDLGSPSNGPLRTFMRMHVDGTNVETVDATEPFNFEPGRSVIASDFSYEIGEPFSIRRVANDGGMLAPISLTNLPSGNRVLGGFSENATDGFALLAALPPTCCVDTPEAGPASLLRWPMMGGTLMTIANGFDSLDYTHVRSAASDANVYFGTTDGLVRVSVNGGTPQKMGPAVFLGGIAFDDTRVYWSSWDGPNGTIYATCK